MAPWSSGNSTVPDSSSQNVDTGKHLHNQLMSAADSSRNFFPIQPVPSSPISSRASQGSFRRRLTKRRPSTSSSDTQSHSIDARSIISTSTSASGKAKAADPLKEDTLQAIVDNVSSIMSSGYERKKSSSSPSKPKTPISQVLARSSSARPAPTPQRSFDSISQSSAITPQANRIHDTIGSNRSLVYNLEDPFARPAPARSQSHSDLRRPVSNTRRSPEASYFPSRSDPGPSSPARPLRRTSSTVLAYYAPPAGYDPLQPPPSALPDTPLSATSAEEAMVPSSKERFVPVPKPSITPRPLKSVLKLRPVNPPEITDASYLSYTHPSIDRSRKVSAPSSLNSYSPESAPPLRPPRSTRRPTLPYYPESPSAKSSESLFFREKAAPSPLAPPLEPPRFPLRPNRTPSPVLDYNERMGGRFGVATPSTPDPAPSLGARFMRTSKSDTIEESDYAGPLSPGEYDTRIAPMESTIGRGDRDNRQSTTAAAAAGTGRASNLRAELQKRSQYRRPSTAPHSSRPGEPRRVFT